MASPNLQLALVSRRILALIGVLGLFGSTGCAPDEVGEDAVRAETVRLGDLRDALYATLFDSVLTSPNDLLLSDGRLYVTDPDASNVTVLDLDLDLVRRIGRRGEGPGELTVPTTTRVVGGIVSVADVGNGRFEFFDTAGVPLGSVPLRTGDEHVQLGLERVIAIDRDPGRMGTIVEAGATHPFGARETGHPITQGPVPMHQLHRARLGADSIVVRIPATSGALQVLNFDGEVLETRTLPEPIQAELQDNQERLQAMFGGAVMASSMVKGAAVSPGGTFVTVASMSDTAPILIHDLDGRRIILVDVSGHMQAGKVQSARVAVYDEGLLYVLAGASLFVFELTLPE